jgi:formylglycine-generating enzyme required for sulfatase activity
MRKIVLLCGIIPMLFLSSCTDDSTHSTPTPVVPAGDVSFSVQSDAIAFADGDAIGVFAVKRNAGEDAALAASGNYLQNVKAVKSGDKWVSDAEFPTDGSVLDFYVYYPYNGNSDVDPLNLTFSDESMAVYAQHGLYVGNADNGGNGYGNTTDPIAITLSDNLLPEVALTLDDTYDFLDLSKTTEVYICNVVPYVKLNLTNSAVVLGEGDVTRVAMRAVAAQTKADGEPTFIVSLPAQEIPAGVSLFEIINDGRTVYSAPLSDPLVIDGDESIEVAVPYYLPTVRIPASAEPFLMGSPDGSNMGDANGSGLNTIKAEPGRFILVEYQHWVKLTRDFDMMTTEVTNKQYADFLNTLAIGSDGIYADAEFTNDVYGEKLTIDAYSTGWDDYSLRWDESAGKWSYLDGYADYPAVYITWEGAYEFAKWVGGKLPTEAQWEFACRGDKGQLPFGIGDGTDLDSYKANIDNRDRYDYANDDWMASGGDGPNVGGPTPVASYEPNSFGLYDMHGNALEWCYNQLYLYPGDSATEFPGVGDSKNNPLVDPYWNQPDNLMVYMTRGGEYWSSARGSRSAARIEQYSMGMPNLGFRVIFER